MPDVPASLSSHARGNREAIRASALVLERGDMGTERGGKGTSLILEDCKLRARIRI